MDHEKDTVFKLTSYNLEFRLTNFDHWEIGFWSRYSEPHYMHGQEKLCQKMVSCIVFHSTYWSKLWLCHDVPGCTISNNSKTDFGDPTCETMTERTALSPTRSSRRLRMHESWAQGAVFLTSWYSSSKRVSLMAAPYFTPPPDIHILDNSPTRPPLSLLLLLLPLNKSVTSRTTEKKRGKMRGHYGTLK